jgi:hypothetical protein
VPTGSHEERPRTASGLPRGRYLPESGIEDWLLDDDVDDSDTRPGWAEMATLAATRPHDAIERDGADLPRVWSRG